MKNNVIKIIILNLFAISSFGQTTFNLNDYYLPKLNYSSLSTIFSLRGNENSNSSQINSNLKVNYYKYYRSTKRQSNIWLSINSQPSFRKIKTDKKDNVYNWNNKLQFNFKNRAYKFKHPKLFLGTGIILNIDYNMIRTMRNNLVNFEIMQSINTSVPLMFGWGRIENITEAWRALRIYNEFDKLQLLKNNIDRDQIMGLANEMAIQRSTRFLDFRKGKMAQLQAIDRFLSSKESITNQNMLYFTTLNDNWLYGINETRLSGTTISIGYEPGVNIIGDKLEYTNFAKFKFETHKAINEFWQFDGAINFKTGSIYNKEFDSFKKRTSANINVKGSYYPSSRTTISTFFSSSIGTLYNLKFNHQINVNYYLSPKTRIQFKTNLSTYKIKNQIPVQRRQVDFSYSVKLKYFFW